MPPARRITLLALALALVAALAPAAAPARTRAPHLADIRCLPVHTPRCAHGPAVPVGGRVLLRGHHFYRGMRVVFRWPKGALATTLLRTRFGWAARVPAGVPARRVWVYVRDRAKRRSHARPVRVIRIVRPVTPPPVTSPVRGLPAPFSGGGMWIWYLDKSEGGDPAAIAARARAAGIGTVFVKSGDGTNLWSQFNADTVAALHAQGLRVCGWQYVYGAHPVPEARVAAAVLGDGADCFLIDPETEYQGRYAQAQEYMNELRRLVGEDFPIAVASFPYVDYHPSLPYSVFLAPGNAQVDAPQVYWKTIGGGVDAVSAHTWMHNRIYNAPVAPIGQSYDSPSPSDITRFRQLWNAYGSGGVSWWSWQSTSDATWSALAAPVPAPAAPIADPGWPSLALKAKGDEVIWLQQHLASYDNTVSIDGDFGAQTDAALRNFQAAHALPVTGTTDPATWQAVLALAVRPVDWTAKAQASTRARAAALPERRDELAGGPRAGVPQP